MPKPINPMLHFLQTGRPAGARNIAPMELKTDCPVGAIDKH